MTFAGQPMRCPECVPAINTRRAGASRSNGKTAPTRYDDAGRRATVLCLWSKVVAVCWGSNKICDNAAEPTSK